MLFNVFLVGLQSILEYEFLNPAGRVRPESTIFMIKYIHTKESKNHLGLGKSPAYGVFFRVGLFLIEPFRI